MRTRFCAQPGGCDDPTCHLCTVVVVELPQPPTYKQLKEREEQKRREAEQKKKRKKR